MNTRSHRILLLLCGCLVGILAAVTGRAEDFYIAETTLGNGSGTSASNAKSVAWFNTSGNWASTKTSGKIGPGDTVRLVGTITTPLTVQASGSEGNPITVLFSKDAKLSNPAFPNTGAIVITGKHYIVIDGGENGLVENTDNGTAESFGNSVGTVGVYGTNANHLHVRNLTFKNIYVRTSTADTRGGGSGVRAMPASGSTFTGLRVFNCTITDAERGISVVFRDIEVTDVEISHNTISNVDDGIFIGSGNTGAKARDFRVHNNRIWGFSKWDEPATNKFHHDGMHIFALGSGSVISDVRVYANTIGSDFGKYSTSGVYFSGKVTGILIYNNTFLGNIDTPANGLVTLRPYGGSSIGIYNNTFIGNGSWGRAVYLNGADGGSKTVEMYNNLATKITFVATTYSESWVVTADYNLGDSLIESREFSHSATSSGSFKTPPQWQNLGFDLNGRFVNALLDSNHEPTKGSPAIDSAKDLSIHFNTDKVGVIRPVGSGWDIGAYESIEGLTGMSSIIDDSTQVVSGDTTAPSTGTSSGDVVIDFTEPTTTTPTTEPVTEEPVIVADSSTSTGSTGTTTDTAPSTDDTIQVVFEPAPSTDTSTSEPVIVADSSTSTDGSTSEPVSAGNTLEPPTTSEPVIVADSSTSTDTSTSTDSSTEPAPTTDSPTIVVVDSSTGTDSTDTSTDTTKGKPGNGYGRETNGKMTKTARIL